MIGPERVCKNCGHRCHCYSPNCHECVNDVCVTCNCEEENYAAIAESLRGTRMDDAYYYMIMDQADKKNQ